MKQLRTALVLVAIMLIGFCWTLKAQEESSRFSAPDEPGEEEVLNRELWQFAKGTPYEAAERHIEEARRKNNAAPPAEVVLPSGWKITPAGAQVEVGRLPEEAVFYAGHIVVLNTGYYFLKEEAKEKDKGACKEKEKHEIEPQEISIVDPAFPDPVSGKKIPKVTKVLRPGSLFPCAVTGRDGDLYISGGYGQKVYRHNNKFKLVRMYELNLNQLNKKYDPFFCQDLILPGIDHR